MPRMHREHMQTTYSSSKKATVLTTDELCSPLLKPFLTIIHRVAGGNILLKETTAMREYDCHGGMCVVCSNTQVGGTCCD